jgi:hypothetical protein
MAGRISCGEGRANKRLIQGGDARREARAASTEGPSTSPANTTSTGMPIRKERQKRLHNGTGRTVQTTQQANPDEGRKINLRKILKLCFTTI